MIYTIIYLLIGIISSYGIYAYNYYEYAKKYFETGLSKEEIHKKWDLDSKNLVLLCIFNVVFWPFDLIFLLLITISVFVTAVIAHFIDKKFKK